MNTFRKASEAAASFALHLEWESFDWANGSLSTEFASDLLPESGSALVASGCYVEQTERFCFVHTGRADDAAAFIRDYLANPQAIHFHSAGAFVLLDFAARRVVAATDRLGRTSVYFASEAGGLSVATQLRDVRALNRPELLSEQSLYSYVYFHMVPAPMSVLAGVSKLRAAESLEADADGLEVKRYWVPRFQESARGLDRKAMQQQLRSLLKESVSRSLGQGGRAGAFLSGGLDSSSVAGMLSEVATSETSAFAIGFEAEGYDEMAYARISAEHFGVKLHEYYVTPDDVVAALPEIAGSFSEPFGNSSALPAYFCARMAADAGFDVLLAGDGGDELFAGNERYAKQRVFERYQDLPGWIRHPVSALAPRLLADSTSLGTKVRSFLRQAETPLPERLWFYSFLEQTDPESVFSADFLSSVDRSGVAKVLKNTYDSATAASALNRMLHLDWQITLADNDLRKVGQACALAGVRVEYPLLDDAILDFSTGIPSAWKLQPGSLRKFYKEAMRGWLPDATLNKAKHGFGLPFGVWMREHAPLRELAHDKVIRLGDRKIFSRQFLETAIRQHQTGHASYFGELVWVLCALELWLEANRPDFRYER